ncbi:hypothetical protein [Flavobacterium weaverense]|uniref:YhhN-like protein n=1 Tax=Flavobacterium weaverense TaxID=271156 RepID=A0A3L9ZXB6_9FLAO|nr:hypothetical protein [Flavobacterium weaverense]RMA75849.1 hypothetical protein BC961_1547 [Flavobacterium weaverense]
MKIKNIKSALLIFPVIFLGIYFCAGIFFDSNLVVYIKPLIIPSFLVYALVNNYNKLTPNYILFVVLFYLNELLILFWDDSVQLFRAALLASFFCYLSLISLGYKSIKSLKLYTPPNGFTLFILALNAVFLIAIMYILISAIGDLYLNVILIFNSLVTILLAITAVLYLGKFANKKAYYYFFGAIALIFNDVFAAIGTYFVENVVLNTFDRLLHFISFYLIYLFVITDKKKVGNHITDSQPQF